MTCSQNKHGPPLKHGVYHRAGPLINKQKWKDLHPPWKGYFRLIWPVARSNGFIAGFWRLWTTANQVSYLQQMCECPVATHKPCVGMVHRPVGVINSPVGMVDWHVGTVDWHVGTVDWHVGTVD